MRTTIAIIGAGIHGATLALQLARKGVDFILIDSEPVLSVWTRATERQNIQRLRTPNKVHLSALWDERALMRLYGLSPVHENYSQMLAEPARLDLFNQHARNTVAEYALEEYRVPGRVRDINMTRGTIAITAYNLETGNDVMITAQRCFVAVGLGTAVVPGDGTMHPDMLMAASVRANNPHWMERQFRGKTVCVVGGGLTAASIASAIAHYAHRVHLCTRRQFSVSQLEADHAWLPGTGILHKEFVTQGIRERMEALHRARDGRGITPEVWKDIEAHADRGKIHAHASVPFSFWGVNTAGKLIVPEIKEPMDSVVHAAGFHQSLDALPFLNGIKGYIKQAGGLPIVNSYFESSVLGLHFLGRLGELHGGPLGRNIPGALYGAEVSALVC